MTLFRETYKTTIDNLILRRYINERHFANSTRRKIAIYFSFFNPYRTLSTKNVRNCLVPLIK